MYLLCVVEAVTTYRVDTYSQSFIVRNVTTDFRCTVRGTRNTTVGQTRKTTEWYYCGPGYTTILGINTPCGADTSKRKKNTPRTKLDKFNNKTNSFVKK